MRKAGIVLCGGRSSRMGLPKATLPFGTELMLQRVVRLLGEAVDTVAVIAAPAQDLPPLPTDVLIAHDRHEGRGPLEGIGAGLTAIQDRADAAFITSCDVPLLVPTFVTLIFDLLADHDIAVPRQDKFHHPLAAVYRTTVLPHVEHLLSQNRLRPFFLFEQLNTCEVSPHEWQTIDPDSHTLANLNTPSDYLAALTTAGFTAPNDVLAQLGT